MKFDKLIEQILTEMPISLYDTPEMTSEFPDVPAMTPEDRKASKQRIIDHLKPEGPRYYNILDKYNETTALFYITKIVNCY